MRTKWGVALGVVAAAVVVGVALLARNGHGERAEVAPESGAPAAAIFAGGCFWCMEAAFEKVQGVVSVVSGYAGGTRRNPTYHEVSTGRTGHAEAVRVLYDPRRVTYEHLLEVFWHNIDPTQADGQFCDIGPQYRSAIFYLDEVQRRLAEESKKAIEESGVLGKPIVTEIVPAGAFYAAEEHHQDFYKKDPVRYHSYRKACGRDRRLKRLWGGAAGR